jgi:hypothetical protein
MAASPPGLGLRWHDRLGGLIHELPRSPHMDDLFGTHTRDVGRTRGIRRVSHLYAHGDPAHIDKGAATVCAVSSGSPRDSVATFFALRDGLK